ncbi:MAG: D-sedoheptulose 7-phosphate isomerase [Bacteroidia bacterium]|jgi:D-sedoheptulose 7-phosphate isomerase
MIDSYSTFKEARSILDNFLSDSENFRKIDDAIRLLVNAFQSGNRVFSCGNGGSMCDAMHFAEELSGRFRNNRPALPAMSISDASHITCVANDYGFEAVFSRFLEAHGKAGDVLLAISTSGNSPNVLRACETAREKGMTVIALSGKDGGKIPSLAHIEIRAPHSEYADRAQEIHIKVIHALIEGVEKVMFA